MDIVSRLKQYLDYRQISVTQFADSCGIPRPSVSQLLNGRNKKVSDEVISKIHAAYPDLSMLWLLFNEGDMAIGANIKISEPQNQAIKPSTQLQQPNNQPIQSHIEYPESPRDIKPDIIFDNTQDEFDVIGGRSRKVNFEPTTSPSQFPWSSPTKPVDAHQSSASQSSPTIPPEDKKKPTITFCPTDKGKRVVSIIVYYDDNSFEPFIPDPSGRNPFVR